jgi:imidazoleglycerol phosphate dehydratase HisB
MIALSFGDVRKKRITTPNHFVSHMIEHIAWRMGLSIELEYRASTWQQLGRELGEAIVALGPRRLESAAALGMIDDGSASVAVAFGSSGVAIETVGGVSRAEFLEARCEQLESGDPLVELLSGLSAGLNAEIAITIWTFEDTHHTWEGIFRGVGIALQRCFAPTIQPSLTAKLAEDRETVCASTHGEVQVLECGARRAVVRRGTAESGVTVTVDCDAEATATCRFDVDPSISYGVATAQEIFSLFAEKLQMGVAVDFVATKLSSSHVVMEDIGLVVGRALLEMLKVRMERYGVQGAGSTIASESDLLKRNIQVGVSVEGRKFWRFIPRDGDYAALRREFLIGQNCCGGLRSEDLDDFVDGLAGGMSASIMIQVGRYNDPDTAWREVFSGLGAAINEAFTLNPFRKGVPPGVKATLG